MDCCCQRAFAQESNLVPLLRPECNQKTRQSHPLLPAKQCEPSPLRLDHRRNACSPQDFCSAYPAHGASPTTAQLSFFKYNLTVVKAALLPVSERIRVTL